MLMLRCDCAGCSAAIPESDGDTWIVVIDGGTHHFCTWAHAALFTSQQSEN